MAGFILDVLVTFLWRGSVRILQLIRSAYWKRGKGVVIRVGVSAPHSLGCPVVKVAYKSMQEGVGEAVSAIPFFFQQSAEDYSQSLRPPDSVVIRINAANSKQTMFFPDDQYKI